MKSKKLLSILFAAIMIISIAIVPVEAADTDTPVDEIEIEEYVVSCPGGSKHQMHPMGPGRIRTSNRVDLIYGYTTQCSVCYQAIISDYKPSTANTLGKYYMFNPGYSLNYYGTVLDNMSSSYLSSFYGSLSTDSYWAGYTFNIA